MVWVSGFGQGRGFLLPFGWGLGGTVFEAEAVVSGLQDVAVMGQPIEQRGTKQRIWSADDTTSDPTWPAIISETIELRPKGPDLAVAIGLTHDVSADARRYCEAALPTVGRLMVLKLSTGPGAQSVMCGRHAFELADAVCSAVRSTKAGGGGRAHLFIAAPNAFTFFLGQRQTALGPVRLYEFDFDGDRGRSYSPAITLPLSKEPAN